MIRKLNTQGEALIDKLSPAVTRGAFFLEKRSSASSHAFLSAL